MPNHHVTGVFMHLQTAYGKGNNLQKASPAYVHVKPPSRCPPPVGGITEAGDAPRCRRMSRVFIVRL